MIKHIVCRNSFYSTTQIKRFFVPDDKIPWSTSYADYSPVKFESDVLKGKNWADLSIGDPNYDIKFNQLDGRVNRISHLGTYNISYEGLPLNPCGRTGISGRGVLGRWGPNHAADPIVSSWERNQNGEIVKNSRSEKPILKILCIKRADTGEIALPGGMVDSGEEVSTALKREFIEETLNNRGTTSELDDFFRHGAQVYRGYVDDPRNTDNAWMETTAVNFHDESGNFLSKLKFEAGDDAVGIQWINLDNSIKLYASHSKFVEEVAKIKQAHF